MKQELQDELYKKYPDIFCQRHLPMSQTCMCWGIDTGDGWYQLIDDLCAKIKAHVDETKLTYPKYTIEFVQVKEKFGTLRVSLDYSHPAIDKFISEAVALSAKTCDVCGDPGHCGSYRGWWMTLCKTHSDEHIAQTGNKLVELDYEEDEEQDEPDAE
jgi:hypothetical protein